MLPLERFTHWRLFLGWGFPSSPSAQIAAAPVPTPAPPVTSSNAEVISVEQDTARQNLAKKSVAQTVWAGDTAGYRPGGSNPAGGVAPIASFRP